MQRDAAQKVTKTLQNRLQHLGMGGDVDGNALGFYLPRRQRFCQRLQRGIGTRDNTMARRIDRSHIQIARQQRAQLGLIQRNGQHAPRYYGVKQTAAQMHQADAIFKAHHPRKAGGRVLTQRMPDKGRRLHPPAVIQFRQRIVGDHDQRQ